MYDQFEDRRVGLRMATFTGPVRDLGGGVQVGHYALRSLFCGVVSCASSLRAGFHYLCPGASQLWQQALPQIAQAAHICFGAGILGLGSAELLRNACQLASFGHILSSWRVWKGCAYGSQAVMCC